MAKVVRRADRDHSGRRPMHLFRRPGTEPQICVGWHHWAMTDHNPVLGPFASLLGSWATEATHPMIDGVVAGTVTVALFAGDHFLLVRSSTAHELTRDSVSVIGAPEAGDGLVMEYFDSRGVRRTYRTSLEDGVWRWGRDVPDFAQAFTAELAPDAFQGHGELARTPGDWGDDLDVTYRRTRSEPTTDGEPT